MISIIVAMDKKGAIGKQGKLPWYLPADLAHFRQRTSAHPIIMGRKTFDSIGKALPNRTNIVITRNPDWHVEKVLKAGTLEEAIGRASQAVGADEIFVIGGGEIFKEAITLVDRLYVTEVLTEVIEADIFFPYIDGNVWQEVKRDSFRASEKNPFGYSFLTYERRNNG